MSEASDGLDAPAFNRARSSRSQTLTDNQTITKILSLQVQVRRSLDAIVSSVRWTVNIWALLTYSQPRVAEGMMTCPSASYDSSRPKTDAQTTDRTVRATANATPFRVQVRSIALDSLSTNRRSSTLSAFGDPPSSTTSWSNGCTARSAEKTT